MSKLEKIEIEKPEKPEIGKIVIPKIKKYGKNQPDFETLFDPDGHPDLSDLNYSENLEEGAEQEMSEALRRIIDEKRALREKYRVNIDAEFFLVLCFQCRDQKEEFLELAGWEHMGDKYMDGLEIAAQMGIKLKIYELDMTAGFTPPKPLQDHPKID